LWLNAVAASRDFWWSDLSDGKKDREI
jgi:hypothetical protein